MLVGLMGDLVTHITSSAHDHEELISFGPGFNPWHLVLFGGIVVSAAAAARAAAALGTRAARTAGAGLAVLSVIVLVMGAIAGIKPLGPEVLDEHVHLASASTSDSSSHAGHTTTSAATSGNAGHAGHTGHAHGGGSGVTEGPSLTGHHYVQPGPVTPAERVVLDQQLAAAKRATAKYRSMVVAQADGYIKVTQFLPGIGMHLANLGAPNDTFDPAEPQVLLYMPSDGGMKLAGVAYSIRHTSDTPPEGFAGGSDVWHFHRDLCFVNGVVTVTPDRSDCPGFFQSRTAWLLHAWVWERNPLGVFTEYNPRVR